MSNPGSGAVRGRRPKSEPRRWRQPVIPSRELYRLAPKPDRPHSVARDAWWKFRHLVRSPWPYIVAAVWAGLTKHPYWAAAAAILSFIFNFFQPRYLTRAIDLDYEFGTDSLDFLTTISGATGQAVIPGNRITIFNNGDEFYPPMLAAVNAAKHSITLEEYIFWDGQIGQSFSAAFAAKAREGVAVKLLVDSVGSATIGKAILRTLEDSGAQLAWFRPIHWYSLHRANNRTHRKTLVVDGTTAFTGGAGLADHWMGSASCEGEWRDVMLKVEGPAAFALQVGFGRNWLEATGEQITGARFFPVPAKAGDHAAHVVLSSPSRHEDDASLLHMIALRSARKSIDIVNPYFVPDEVMLELLSDALKRGVKARIVVAGRSNDAWVARMNSIRLYGRLIRAGAEIYEYPTPMLHQKFMLVDGRWATVGTANFDNRSFRLNEEANVAFFDPELVDRMYEIFHEDLRISDRVTLEEYEKRGALQRAGELIASLIQDQV